MDVKIALGLDVIKKFQEGEWVGFESFFSPGHRVVQVRCGIRDVEFGTNDAGNPVVRRLDLVRERETRKREDAALQSLP